MSYILKINFLCKLDVSMQDKLTLRKEKSCYDITLTNEFAIIVCPTYPF